MTMCINVEFRKKYRTYKLKDLTNTKLREIIKSSIRRQDCDSFYLDYTGYDLCKKLGILDSSKIIYHDIDVISDHLAGVYIKVCNSSGF